MSAVLDTNVLIRHVTGDPPGHARRATTFLSTQPALVLPDVVVAEFVFVLESYYEVARSVVAMYVLLILALPSIVVRDRDLLLRSLDVYQTARVHFVDAYIAAEAESSGVGRVASFDRSLDRVESIERIEP